MKILITSLMMFALSIAALAQDGRSSNALDQGTIVSIHAREINIGFVFASGWRGRGPTLSETSRASCEVETATQTYRFATGGKMPKYTLGQSIEFRAGRDKIYVVDQNGKEHKYPLMAMQEKGTNPNQ